MLLSCQRIQLHVPRPYLYLCSVAKRGSTTSHGTVVSTMGAKSRDTVSVRQGVWPGKAKAGSDVPLPLFSSGIVAQAGTAIAAVHARFAHEHPTVFPHMEQSGEGVAVAIL